MLIKHCTRNFYYDFDPRSFRLFKKPAPGEYQGKLFILGNDQCVLWRDNEALMFQTRDFTVNVRDCKIQYQETRWYSHLTISSGDRNMHFKQRKSIWEWFDPATYDYLDKIGDNKLFYVYDVMQEFRRTTTEAEVAKFILAF